MPDRDKSKRKHESSSSSSSYTSSSSSASSSSSSTSSSSDSSDSDEKRTSPPIRKIKKIKIDLLEEVPEANVTKTYDDFDVPSRDYNPSPGKNWSSPEESLKKRSHMEGKREKEMKRDRHSSEESTEEKRGKSSSEHDEKTGHSSRNTEESTKRDRRNIDDKNQTKRGGSQERTYGDRESGEAKTERSRELKDERRYQDIKNNDERRNRSGRNSRDRTETRRESNDKHSERSRSNDKRRDTKRNHSTKKDRYGDEKTDDTKKDENIKNYRDTSKEREAETRNNKDSKRSRDVRSKDIKTDSFKRNETNSAIRMRGNNEEVDSPRKKSDEQREKSGQNKYPHADIDAQNNEDSTDRIKDSNNKKPDSTRRNKERNEQSRRNKDDTLEISKESNENSDQTGNDEKSDRTGRKDDKRREGKRRNTNEKEDINRGSEDDSRVEQSDHRRGINEEKNDRKSETHQGSADTMIRSRRNDEKMDRNPHIDEIKVERDEDPTQNDKNLDKNPDRELDNIEKNDRARRNDEKTDRHPDRADENADRTDRSRRNDKRMDRNMDRVENNAERNDRSRGNNDHRADRTANKNDNYQRNRSWYGNDRNRDYRRRSPRNDSDNRRSRRSHEKYNSRRGDYSDGNQSMMRRYWDNEPRDSETRRKRGHESDEEFVIGERFYGDDRRKRDTQHEPPSSRDKEKKNMGDEKVEDPEKIPQSQKRTVDLLTSKTGGAYIPPAKLRMMQAEITDKSGAAYQRIAWEALKKSIHGHINKINTSNIGLITRELLRENIVRGRGLLARSIIQAQAASPTFTPVYAALTAVVNSKFPNIGELLLKRLVIQFKRGFRRNNKPLCISSGTFIAHLVNQRVAHEILALEFLTLLVETPTDDSIEVAIAFLKECGMKLTEMSRKGIEAIFEMLRNILHEGQLDKRVQYMIEVMFQIRKDGFKDHEAVGEELDLVEEEQQYTHLITLDEPMDSQDILNVFKFDPDYVTNEEKYKQLSKEILDTDGSGSESEGDGEDGDSSEEESSDADAEAKEGLIVDNTETNLTALRRTIYLTIHSSLDFEECAHKLMKMQLKPGQEIELCHMFLDCCAEMRTYEKFFGLLAGRFCAINKIYVTPFEQIFKDSYDTIHRLDTNKLRNVSKFFAHLLFTDSISWGVLNCIRLNEEDTTSSSRIFIKILFQELSEYMGLSKLNQRVKDVTLQEAFEGLFPRDDPKNTRFAINFFTSIGLGGLTDDLREHLKSRPKPIVVPPVIKEDVSPSSSSSTSSSSSSSSDSSSESSDSSSSEEERKRKKKKSKKAVKSSSKSKSEKQKRREERVSSSDRKERKQRKDKKESRDSRSSKNKSNRKKEGSK